MKIVWNKKYTTIAVYAIIVLVCSALLALAAAYLPSVASSLGSVLSVVKTVIYGLVFAYILNPLNKVLEKRALKFLSKKKDHRKAQDRRYGLAPQRLDDLRQVLRRFHV